MGWAGNWVLKTCWQKENRKVLDENWERVRGQECDHRAEKTTVRELRGAHLPALGPAARPLLRVEEGTAARPEQGNVRVTRA